MQIVAQAILLFSVPMLLSPKQLWVFNLDIASKRV
jgi:hypothetical protein